MFSLEEVYGVSRNDYCIITGISSHELSSHLSAEVVVLKDNLNRLRDAYRDGGNFTDDKQRYRASLITHIEAKIERKESKIKDIQKHIKGE